MRIPGITSGGVTGAIQASIGNQLAKKQMSQDSKARRQGLYMDAARLGLGAGELANRVYQPAQNRQLQRDLPGIQAQAHLQEFAGLTPLEVERYSKLTPGVLARQEGSLSVEEPFRDRERTKETEAKKSLMGYGGEIEQGLMKLKTGLESPAERAERELNEARAKQINAETGYGGAGFSPESRATNVEALQQSTLNDVGMGEYSPEMQARILAEARSPIGPAGPLGMAYRFMGGFQDKPPKEIEGQADLSSRGLPKLLEDPAALNAVLTSLMDTNPDALREPQVLELLLDKMKVGSQGQFNSFDSMLAAVEALQKKRGSQFNPDDHAAMRVMSLLNRFREKSGEAPPAQGPELPIPPSSLPFRQWSPQLDERIGKWKKDWRLEQLGNVSDMGMGM